MGQRVLEVNGTSLLGATHLVAVRALRNNPMEVSLLVCDGYDPKEVLRKKNMEEKRRSSTLSANMDTSSLSSEGENIIPYTRFCLFKNTFLKFFCKLIVSHNI